jgi:hypothetical protein
MDVGVFYSRILWGLEKDYSNATELQEKYISEFMKQDLKTSLISEVSKKSGVPADVIRKLVRVKKEYDEGKIMIMKHGRYMFIEFVPTCDEVSNCKSFIDELDFRIDPELDLLTSCGVA